MILDTEESVDANGILFDKQYTYEKMLNAYVALQVDKKFVAGQVKNKTLGT